MRCSNAGREWQRRPKLSSLADADDTTAIAFTLIIFCDLLLGGVSAGTSSGESCIGSLCRLHVTAPHCARNQLRPGPIS